MIPPQPPPPSAFEEPPASAPPPPAPETWSSSCAEGNEAASPAGRIPFRSDVPPDYIRHMVNEEGRKFDLYVLTALLRNPLLVDQVLRLLCIDPCVKPTRFPINERWDDFLTDEINALYACVRKHRQVNPTGDNITRGLLETMLNQLATELHSIVSQEGVPAVLTVFDAAMALDAKEAAEVVRDGFIYWLRKRRMFLVMRKECAVATWDAGQINETLAVHAKLIDQLLESDKEAFVAFDKIVEPPPVELIPSGLRACDESLGGGFGKGEFSLVVAPSGSGKTTFGCQLAGTFGLQKFKVLFITTEQPPNELQPRIVSNLCGIRFDRIRGGLQRSALSLDERSRYEKICGSLGANLHFADWSKNRSRSIRTDLRTEVERLAAQNGRVDVVIFDWIGRALGTGVGKDQHALRLAFQETGDALADIAREMKIVVIGFAQAAIGTTRGKKRIEQDDIAECKSLGRSATNVIGISALRDETDDDGANFSPIQYLFVSKARKSAGGCRRFRRQFEFQRLADV